MPQRKEKADSDRSLSLLHQLARHIVDRCNMVGIDRVTKPKAVRQHRGSNQDWLMDERNECPNPGRQIGDDENGIDCNNPTAKAEQLGFAVIGRENRFHKRGHGSPPPRDIFIKSSQRKTAPCARTARWKDDLFRPVSWLAGHNASSPSRALFKKPSGIPKKGSPPTVAGAASDLACHKRKQNRTEFPLLINVTSIPNTRALETNPRFLSRRPRGCLPKYRT